MTKPRTEVINDLGSSATLPATSHPDIEEFIDAKAHEEKKAWALIDAGYDGSFNGEAYASVMYQNENLSVQASDAFMKAAVDGKPWITKRVTDGRDCETKDAATLLRKMAEGVHVCGDPGIQFYDTPSVTQFRDASSTTDCLVGETLVDTSEGKIRIDELEMMVRANRPLPLAFSYDRESNLPALRRIIGVRFCRYVTNVAEITTDKGLVVRCTPEHPFLKYKGDMVQAQNLQAGTRLTKICRVENRRRGGRQYINHGTTDECKSGTEWMNRWMWAQVHGPIPAGMEIHHIDGNRHNDKLSNLELIKKKEHRSFHAKGAANPRAIRVQIELLVDAWEHLEAMTWANDGTPKLVTCARWNRYVRKMGLQGKVPVGRYDVKDGARIQGLTWKQFEQKIRTHQSSVNDRVVAVRIIELDAAVPVYNLEVEEAHNFGIASAGAEKPHSLIVGDASCPGASPDWGMN